MNCFFWIDRSIDDFSSQKVSGVLDHQPEFDRLLGCLAEGNQEWARSAPVLMLSVAKLNFERNGIENRHAFHDVGAASANLAVQATAQGLFTALGKLRTEKNIIKEIKRSYSAHLSAIRCNCDRSN